MRGGIRILKKTKPHECGGTDASIDTRAPREILSEDMILFDVTSTLPETYCSMGPDPERIGYVSAFAVPAAAGTFLFFETGSGFRRRDERKSAWALVRENVFTALASMTREQKLARSNGFHSETHGLPENFGGDIDIRYAGGERISICDNQSPVLSREEGEAIAALFTGAMRGEPVPLPDPAALREIRFREDRRGGGFTEARLTIRDDGTAVNERKSRYDGPDVYESAKSVSAETVARLREKIAGTGLLAWETLPTREYAPEGKKILTFLFDGGDEITVPDCRLVPRQLWGGFFGVELELTTKN